MNIKKTAIALGLAGVLTLGACSGGSTGAPETSTPTEVQTVTETPSEEPTEAPALPMDAPPGIPSTVNATVDENGVFRAEVGETFALADYNGSGAYAAFTVQAVGYVDNAGESGETVALIVFEVDNTEGTYPVSLAAPIDGGGWSYTSPDGYTESFWDNMMNYSSTIDGRVPVLGGSYAPGTKKGGMVEVIVVDQPGGSISYVDPSGYVLAEIALPEQGVNLDHPAIIESLEVGGMFGHLVSDF